MLRSKNIFLRCAAAATALAVAAAVPAAPYNPLPPLSVSAANSGLGSGTNFKINETTAVFAYPSGSKTITASSSINVANDLEISSSTGSVKIIIAGPTYLTVKIPGALDIEDVTFDVYGDLKLSDSSEAAAAKFLSNTILENDSSVDLPKNSKISLIKNAQLPSIGKTTINIGNAEIICNKGAFYYTASIKSYGDIEKIRKEIANFSDGSFPISVKGTIGGLAVEAVYDTETNVYVSGTATAAGNTAAFTDYAYTSGLLSLSRGMYTVSDPIDNIYLGTFSGTGTARQYSTVITNPADGKDFYLDTDA